MPGVVLIGKAYHDAGEKVKKVDALGVQQIFNREFFAAVGDAGTSKARLCVNLSRSGFAVGPDLFRIPVTEAIELAFSLIDDLSVHSYRQNDKMKRLIDDLASRQPVALTKRTHDLSIERKASSTRRHASNHPSTDRKLPPPDNFERKSSEINSRDFIYILSNPSMPGYVKVGRTNTTLEQRLAELHSTGVPTRFELELSLEVKSSVDSERKAHNALSKFRPEKNREFFKIPVKEAIQIVLSALDEFKVHNFRENYGIERLVQESIAKNRETRERRNKEIELLKSELAQVEPHVAQIETLLQQEEDRYRLLGAYPTNPFGAFPTIALLLFPVVIIGSSRSENAEGIILFFVITLACMFVFEAHLEKEVDEKVIPFNKTRERIDRLKKELRPLQKRSKDLRAKINFLGQDPSAKLDHAPN